MLSEENQEVISARAFWLLTILVIPVFFDSSGLFNSTDPDARGLPASMIFIAGAPLIIFYKHNKRSLFVLAALCIPIIFIWLLGGVLNSGQVSFTLIGVYFVPILVGYCANFFLSEFEGDEANGHYWAAWSIVISAVSIAWISSQISSIFLMGRANGAVWGIFVIYQVWVYWPTVLAISFCLLAAKRGYVILIAKIILFSAILTTGAREPILFCMVFYLVYFLMMRSLRSLMALLTFIFAILGAGVTVFTYLPESIIAIKLISQLSGEQGLSAGRFGVLEQFNFADVNPLIGTGFTLDAVFGSPHNQYLELYYRGGLLPVIAIVSCLIFACFSGRQDRVLASLVITLMIVSFNINVPLRSPYAGAIIWFIVFRMIPRPARQTNQ